MKTREKPLTYQDVITSATLALGTDLNAKQWFCSPMEIPPRHVPIELFRTGRHDELRKAIEDLKTKASP